MNRVKMISEKEIMKKVYEYAKTEEGKAAIKAATGMDYDETFTVSKAKSYGNKLKDILYKHIVALIKSFSINDIIVGDVMIGKDGRYSMKISFDDEALKRQSLRPDLYPEGLQNIILLFAHGYHTNKPIYGVWHKETGDVRVRGRRDREPNNYLHEAINEFNILAKGIAFAQLEEKYN